MASPRWHGSRTAERSKDGIYLGMLVVQCSLARSDHRTLPGLARMGVESGNSYNACSDEQKSERDAFPNSSGKMGFAAVERNQFSSSKTGDKATT